MKHVSLACALSLGSVLGLAAAAHADFAGQPILGPLGPGSAVSGNTLGAADDNAGFESGYHPFGIWDSGDDVWVLNWPGGDLTVTLDSLGGADNDLFVYTPGSLDSSGDYSTVGAHDEVTIPGAAAGTYYINIDSYVDFFTQESSGGAYDLSISEIPAPASGVLVGAGLMCLGRRRR